MISTHTQHCRRPVIKEINVINISTCIFNISPHVWRRKKRRRTLCSQMKRDWESHSPRGGRVQLTELVLGLLAQFPEGPDRCHSDGRRDAAAGHVTHNPGWQSWVCGGRGEGKRGFKALPPALRHCWVCCHTSTASSMTLDISTVTELNSHLQPIDCINKASATGRKKKACNIQILHVVKEINWK